MSLVALTVITEGDGEGELGVCTGWWKHERPRMSPVAAAAPAEA